MYKRPIFPLILLIAVFLALPIYSEINERGENKGQLYSAQKPPCIGEPKVVIGEPKLVIAQGSFKHTTEIYKELCQPSNVFDQKDQKIDDPNS